MKKKFALFLACILAFSIFVFPASAADLDAPVTPIQPDEYTYLANAWAGLTRSSGHWYDVIGGAGSAFATMNIKVTVILQKMVNYNWQDQATWSGEGAFSASAGGERYISATGTYRTKMYAEIYNEDGTFGESVTIFSDHLIIP